MFSFLKKKRESSDEVRRLSSDEVTGIPINFPNETEYWNSEIYNLGQEIKETDNAQIKELLNYKIALIREYMREGVNKIDLEQAIADPDEDKRIKKGLKKPLKITKFKIIEIANEIMNIGQEVAKLRSPPYAGNVTRKTIKKRKSKSKRKRKKRKSSRLKQSLRRMRRGKSHKIKTTKQKKHKKKKSRKS